MTSPLRILVVEDNPGDVRIVQETLRKDLRWPFELYAEGRLSAGLERLRKERIDLVLLDLGLPDARGLATLEDVQREAPAVPVVVLTGSDDQETALRAIQEGAQDYLVKGSVDGDRLWRSIRYGIERKRSEEAQRLAFERLGQIEELKVANQLKLRLLSEATHELNTPLTPLKIQIQMLKSGAAGPLTPEQAKAVGILERNLDRLRSLLSDLLDVARLQNKRLIVRREPLQLERLVREAAETFEAAAARSGIALSVRTAPAQVWGDPNRLTQVVVNLLSNALKFTPAGGRVEVTLGREGHDAVVRVADTGPGLTPEQMQRLFAPFSQVHDPVKVHAGGTGLGLYISKGILEQHGGRVWCESEGPGKGTSFCFAVPLSDVAPTGAEPPMRVRLVEAA